MAKRRNAAGSIETICEPFTLYGPVLKGDLKALRRSMPNFPGEPTPAAKSKQTRHGRFTAAEITRAIRAVTKAGQSVSGTEITVDGTIRILHGDAAESAPSQYDRWKARRDARPT